MKTSALSLFWPQPALWCALGVLAVLVCLGVWGIGGHIAFHNPSLELLVIILPLAFATLRLSTHPRLRAAASGLAFVFLAWPFLRLFNHLVMTTALPLQDSFLAQLDQALGFDWVVYLQWAERHHGLLIAMSRCYTSLTTVSCIVFMLLVCIGDVREAGSFLVLFFWSAVIASSVGLFFPAFGAMSYYAPTAQSLSIIPLDAGTWFVEPLRHVRETSHPLFSLAYMPGLTAFPSFHTAMGIIILYCTRTRLYLFSPALAFVTLMIGSTPIFGGHYFVDLIAGLVLALGLIWLVHRARHAAEADRLPAAPVMAPAE